MDNWDRWWSKKDTRLYKLVDGYNGIEVADAAELVATLEALKAEFEQGALDHLFAVSAK